MVNLGFLLPTSTDMFPLYTELLGGVVDHIDQRRDLWTCAFVCHDFYQAASRHLYRHLYVKLRDLAHNSGERHCEMLNALFEAKPYVLDSLRSLRLDVPTSGTGVPPSDHVSPCDRAFIAIHARESLGRAENRETSNGSGQTNGLQPTGPVSPSCPPCC